MVVCVVDDAEGSMRTVWRNRRYWLMPQTRGTDAARERAAVDPEQPMKEEFSIACLLSFSSLSSCRDDTLLSDRLMVCSKSDWWRRIGFRFGLVRFPIDDKCRARYQNVDVHGMKVVEGKHQYHNADQHYQTILISRTKNIEPDTITVRH